MPAYSFKKRFVAPIQVGLGIYRGESETAFRATWPAAKRQTIRAFGKRRHARPGETIQLYTAMRTKQCEKIGDGRCTALSDINLVFGERRAEKVHIWAPDKATRIIRSTSGLDDFARLDGFEDWQDMKAFWAKEHPGVTYFEGVLIEWEPLA